MLSLRCYRQLVFGPLVVRLVISRWEPMEARVHWLSLQAHHQLASARQLREARTKMIAQQREEDALGLDVNVESADRLCANKPLLSNRASLLLLAQ